MKSIELIKRHEGFRSKPYKDTEGVLTIAYGRNLEKGISDRIADAMFEEDMEDVYTDCHRFDWYGDLNPIRQAVIENMMFNLGFSRFSGFKKTIKLIEESDFDEAASEMLRSKWAAQVGNRSLELAEMMRTGQWPRS